MKKITYEIDNEIQLSIFTDMLEKERIRFEIKKTDSSIYPGINKSINPYALVEVDETDASAVSDIYDNISRPMMKVIASPPRNKRRVLRIILFVIAVLAMISIIIFNQQGTL